MEYYLGDIQLFAYRFVPQGWLLCNGTVLQILQNQALFSLIGNKFGGNGSSTFALPNMTNDSPVAGMNYYICISGIYPMRD
jgi:microcystin-dependent protein